MITKLKTNSYELHIETKRFILPKTPWNKRIYKFCNLNAIENETYFILIYPFYKDSRQTYDV